MSTPIFPPSAPEKRTNPLVAAAVLLLVIAWYAALIAGLGFLLSLALTIPFWNAVALVIVAVGVLVLATPRRKR